LYHHASEAPSYITTTKTADHPLPGAVSHGLALAAPELSLLPALSTLLGEGRE